MEYEAIKNMQESNYRGPDEGPPKWLWVVLLIILVVMGTIVCKLTK